MGKMLEDTPKSDESSNSSVYWRLKTDDAGNGHAVIRFLPQKDLDAPAFVESYSFYFTNKRTNNTYSGTASRTFGKDRPDPVAQFNTWCWSQSESPDVSKEEGDRIKNVVRTRSQKHQYYSNILVVKDPANPENEGKVFVYRYGKKIYEKIHSQMFPKFEDDQPCVPFDMFDGKDFRLVSKIVSEYPNYDDSSFAALPSAVGSDSKIEDILEQTHDLNALVLDPSKDKSYDDKLKSLKRVMGDDELFLEWTSTLDTEVETKPAAKKPAPAAKPKADTKTLIEDTAPEIDLSSSLSAESVANDDVDDILNQLGF